MIENYEALLDRSLDSDRCCHCRHWTRSRSSQRSGKKNNVL